MYETTWTREGDWSITLPADITEDEFMALGGVIDALKAQMAASA